LLVTMFVNVCGLTVFIFYVFNYSATIELPLSSILPVEELLTCTTTILPSFLFHAKTQRIRKDAKITLRLLYLNLPSLREALGLLTKVSSTFAEYHFSFSQ